MSSDPTPGFYRTKLVKGGPFVPVKIWYADGDRCPETGDLMSDQKFRCRLGDQEQTWDWAVQRWPWMQPITKREHDYLLARGRWAAAHAPAAPEANPKRAVKIGELQPIF